ncbi:precorrin-8X methylmutase [Anaeropeptidivorans aminofermentans]|jgi:precorrin-8X/cobalt-precorrin-8 methylmutase|uniref:precorrin-8X methylmutase n=1 Tax=Anaeropeptidivorans aminofermentans TaxID=2934315 RepID=UPI002024D0AA|nr:precorrin-8X methylmutase [Anaeropeptidivorans aminofermentans]
MDNFFKLPPDEIENKSFEIITQELSEKGIQLKPEEEMVIKRAIHTSADFDYAENLKFSANAVNLGIEALKSGISIVTDTNMAASGINKAAAKRLGVHVHCFMADEDIAIKAKADKTTRAAKCMDKAAEMGEDFIIAVGNAPTALIRLKELIDEKKIKPRLIIAVPVGFVNVVESKEMIASLDIPYIAAMGRKGGSNIAAAICNALLYLASPRI